LAKVSVTGRETKRPVL